MLQAITLLETEIRRIKILSKVLEVKADRLSYETTGSSDLYARAKYREEEARRFQVILDILEAEYYDRQGKAVGRQFP